MEERLSRRETDTAESIAHRLENAKKEMSASTDYDVIIINNDLNVAIEELKKVIEDTR